MLVVVALLDNVANLLLRILVSCMLPIVVMGASCAYLGEDSLVFPFAQLRNRPLEVEPRLFGDACHGFGCAAWKCDCVASGGSEQDAATGTSPLEALEVFARLLEIFSGAVSQAQPCRGAAL